MRTRATKAYKQNTMRSELPQYHYVMTINSIIKEQSRWTTVTGVLEYLGDRNGAFNNRLLFACETLGCLPENAEVIFWSFEPNELP